MALTTPSPLHILRTHAAQINCLFFSDDNERLYSGDLQGWVTITSTRTLRSLARWQAHSDSVLAVQEWNESILTHSRDHKLHVWSRLLPPPALVESADEVEPPSTPSLLYSLDVNALNFCRFSLLPLSDSKALVALPNLVDSNYIDIWELPSIDRRHAAIGMLDVQQAGSDDSTSPRQKLGAVMAVHIFEASPPHQSILKLYCLVGYEDGSVALYSRGEDATIKTIEGRGWTQLWRRREHAESIFALGLAPGVNFAISTSADTKLVKYDLLSEGAEKPLVHVSKHPGNGAVTIRRDGRVCAIGGWDGKIHLYSTKKFKSLGTLTYHKDGCHAVCFARPVSSDEIDVEEEDMEVDELISRGLWLASGGKDSRICIWPLISFERKETTQ